LLTPVIEYQATPAIYRRLPLKPNDHAIYA
jgi:hypothetical protein